MHFVDMLLGLLGLPIPGRGESGIDRAERTGCAVVAFVMGIAVVAFLLIKLLEYVWKL